MKISANWIRDFVSLSADDRKMADELTHSGIAVEGYYNSGDDLCYEAEVTTNRVDAMNHYGVAREVSAIFDVDLKPLHPKIIETSGLDFPITIEDPQGCARYTARVVRGVKIAPSPQNIAHRLELIDQRPINNVADATNYVLNEVGQPTHAFDLDKLEGGKIVVRRARDGEVLKTLDGVDRKLTSEDLVIADAVKPVALAGIMGGEASMITDTTQNVLIESAWFDPVTIRRTARRLGMHTDASHRFERGADYGITPVACARVAGIIMSTAGGQVGAEIDVVARRVEFPRVQLRHSEVRRILGADISDAEIARILRRLGFELTPGRAAAGSASTATGSATTQGVGGTGAAVAETIADYVVRVPSWRLDVEREIDLIEEIARIYGYLKLPSTLPAFAGAVVELPTARKSALMRTRLLALGYNESISTTFIPQAEAAQFGHATPVRLANPLSEEAAYMRTSLLPGLVDQVAYNLNRGNQDVRLFEAGHIFELDGDRVHERPSIAVVATGNALDAAVSISASKPQPYTFFHLKGDVEQLIREFEVSNMTTDRTVPEYYHPGRAARLLIDGAEVARFGQLHPDLAASRKLKQDVFLAELMVERLFERELRAPHYKPVPKFPAVERDFSMLFPEGTEFERMRAIVTALNIAELKSFEAVEIFRGGSLPKDRYSMLVRAKFQSPDHTLRDEEISLWSQQIIKALESLGGTMRA